MAATLSPTLEVAHEILKPAGLKGMHISEIAERAVKANKSLGLSAEEFEKKLQSALAGNLNLKTQKPSFARVEGKKPGTLRRGWYRVKIEKSPPVITQIEPPQTEKAFLGKGGEFAVMSELLFWGYNPSAMAVDTGIDLVASRGEKYFHIQVKTASEQEGGRFQFTIKYSSFKEHHSSSMFYVFVLRRGLANQFIIIPSSFLQSLISAGRIASNPTMAVTISVDSKGKKYLLNGSTDVGLYLGNFGGQLL